MSLGIPLELITMLGSGLIGGVMTIWGKSIENRQRMFENAITAAKTQGSLFADARKINTGGFAYTRRLLAILAMLAIIVWPKVVAVFWPEVGVTVGYTEWNPGFLFFEGSEQTQWRQLSGLVITPLDTHIMSAVVGLYFGASIVKNAR